MNVFYLPSPIVFTMCPLFFYLFCLNLISQSRGAGVKTIEMLEHQGGIKQPCYRFLISFADCVFCFFVVFPCYNRAAEPCWGQPGRHERRDENSWTAPDQHGEMVRAVRVCGYLRVPRCTRYGWHQLNRTCHLSAHGVLGIVGPQTRLLHKLSRAEFAVIIFFSRWNVMNSLQVIHQ